MIDDRAACAGAIVSQPQLADFAGVDGVAVAGVSAGPAAVVVAMGVAGEPPHDHPEVGDEAANEHASITEPSSRSARNLVSVGVVENATKWFTASKR
ncbi:MAG: hypothetical protein ACHREM_21175, partial [Polyangiales bacterium]